MLRVLIALICASVEGTNVLLTRAMTCALPGRAASFAIAATSAGSASAQIAFALAMYSAFVITCGAGA